MQLSAVYSWSIRYSTATVYIQLQVSILLFPWSLICCLHPWLRVNSLDDLKSCLFPGNSLSWFCTSTDYHHIGMSFMQYTRSKIHGNINFVHVIISKARCNISLRTAHQLVSITLSAVLLSVLTGPSREESRWHGGRSVKRGAWDPKMFTFFLHLFPILLRAPHRLAVALILISWIFFFIVHNINYGRIKSILIVFFVYWCTTFICNARIIFLICARISLLSTVSYGRSWLGL